VQLYDSFVKHVEHRINPLALVRTACVSSKQLARSDPPTASEARARFNWLVVRLLARSKALPVAPRVVAALELASLRLQESLASGAASLARAASTAGAASPAAAAAAGSSALPDLVTLADEPESSEGSGSGSGGGGGSSSPRGGGRGGGGGDAQYGVTVPQATVEFPARSVNSALSDGNGLRACRRVLEALKDTLAALEGEGEDPLVAATFHRVASEYHRAVGPAGAFYRHSLRYLSLTPLESMPTAQQQQVASELAVAALVAEDVHDLGIVASHPALRSLQAAPELSWIAELVLTANAGDVERFAAVFAEHRDRIAAHHVAILDAAETIKEKVALTAVVESIARRPAADRSIPLADVARAAFCDADIDRDGGALSLATQRLLMRAMSLGLLRGRIDEVDAIVHVDAVRPRVLDAPGIHRLKLQVDSWIARVHSTATTVEHGAADVLA
jgi:hypothetical protein